MTICLVSLRLICLRYLIEMHSTPRSWCANRLAEGWLCSKPHTSLPGREGRMEGGRGERAGESTHAPERRGETSRENKKNYCFLIFKNSLRNLIKAEEKLTFLLL